MAAEHLILLRTAEKFHDLAKFFHSFVNTCHVVERDPEILLGIHLAPRAAEGHRTSRAADSPHHQKEEHAKQSRQEQHRQPVPPRARGILVPKRNGVLLEELHELRLGVLAGEFRRAELPLSRRQAACQRPQATGGRLVFPSGCARSAAGSLPHLAGDLEGPNDHVVQLAVADGRGLGTVGLLHRHESIAPLRGRRQDQAFEVAVGE